MWFQMRLSYDIHFLFYLDRILSKYVQFIFLISL